MLPLYEESRPKSLDEVVGQDGALEKLDVLRRRGLGGRVFWVTGQSGTGKTTIGRLIAAEVADAYAIIEVDAQRLNLEKVREFDRMCRFRPLGQKGHHAIIVNESHGLHSKVVSELQTVLESYHVQRTSTWVFTTTNQGQQRLFDTKFDAVPFLSRAIAIELEPSPVTEFAERVRQIAEENDLDGQPLEKYKDLARKTQCNMREMLQACEAGAMLRSGPALDLDALLESLV